VEKLAPDLMVLDLGLPRRDGLDVLAEMQARFRSISVVVLTGRAGMEERVRCLELGADDVVLKPFSFHELRARLHAMSRRRGQFEDPELRFGDLVMDRAERTVTRAGRPLDLTATEFLLLESLLRRRGERVCTRAELLHEVWRMPDGAESTRGAKDSAGTNIVEVYINYLRKKLGAGAPARLSGAIRSSGQSVIRTVRGEGYLLCAPARSGSSAGRRADPDGKIAPEPTPAERRTDA
jgi:DNA-binding response OmpR family regulator